MSVHGGQLCVATSAGWCGFGMFSPGSARACQPSVLWACPSPSIPGWKGVLAGLQAGGDWLLVKFSVGGGAAAQGPPATRAATWALLPGGGQGLALPGARPILTCAPVSGPEGQACALGGRCGSGAEKCKVRGLGAGCPDPCRVRFRGGCWGGPALSLAFGLGRPVEVGL